MSKRQKRTTELGSHTPSAVLDRSAGGSDISVMLILGYVLILTCATRVTMNQLQALGFRRQGASVPTLLAPDEAEAVASKFQRESEYLVRNVSHVGGGAASEAPLLPLRPHMIHK